MTWSRLPGDAWNNGVLADLSSDAKALWFAAWSFCGGNETDGRLTARDVRVICAGLSLAADAGKELVESGLWERDDKDVLVKGYLDVNPTQEQIAAMRMSKSEAGRIGGQRSGEVRRAKVEARSTIEAPASDQLEAKPKHVFKQNRSTIEAPASGATQGEIEARSTIEARNDNVHVNDNDNDRLTMPLKASSSITGARAREPTSNADPPFEINGHDPAVLAVMQSFSLRLTETGYRSMMSMLQGHQSLSKQWITEAIACYGDYSKRGEHINNAAALFDRWLKNVEIGRSPPTATRDSLEADKWARNAQDPVVIRHQQANEERKRKREEAKRAETERPGGSAQGEAGRGAAQKPRAP